MRLPLLLCVALASALAGCNDRGCTLDHCTISSMMGDGRIRATSAYKEAPAREQSQRVASRERSSPKSSNGFVAPGIVRGGCSSPTAAGEYDTGTNKIHLCKGTDGSWRRYVIAHETGHAVDYQKDGKFEPDLEYWADQYAVNQLLQEGDCAAIAVKASLSTDPVTPYTPGTDYARELYATHC